MSLVLVAQFVAKCSSGRVKHNADIVRLIIVSRRLKIVLKRNGTLVGTPEGAFMRFIGAKNARYTCAMASTRNSFLRGAVPGSLGVACEEAILSSIVKRLNALCADKRRVAQRPRTTKNRRPSYDA